jgi:hypothetical protein
VELELLVSLLHLWLTNEVGVLTKADTVQDADFPQWARVLNDKRYILPGYGYYATRLPGASAKEMNWTWDEARYAEKSFFGRAPWNKFAKRLGISSLTEALSSGLAALISARFFCSNMVLMVKTGSLH